MSGGQIRGDQCNCAICLDYMTDARERALVAARSKQKMNEAAKCCEKCLDEAIQKAADELREFDHILSEQPDK